MSRMLPRVLAALARDSLVPINLIPHEGAFSVPLSLSLSLSLSLALSSFRLSRRGDVALAKVTAAS